MRGPEVTTRAFGDTSNAKASYTYREDSIHPKLTLIGHHYNKFCPLGLIFVCVSSLGQNGAGMTWKADILLRMVSNNSGLFRRISCNRKMADASEN